jgi:hypothetical protein
MNLIIVLNAVSCFAVILAVASPLLWAIFTQHRDQPGAVTGSVRVAEHALAQRERTPARHARPEIAAT